MSEITFSIPPSYRMIARNCLRFDVVKDDEDISALATAKKGDVLVLDEAKFIIDLSPQVYWKHPIGRKTADSPKPRLTEATIVGHWEGTPTRGSLTGRWKIYTRPDCPYCVQAKELMKQKGIKYEEIMIDSGQEKLPNFKYVTVQQLRDLIPGVKTVPQIFRDDTLIGGFTDLKAALLK